MQYYLVPCALQRHVRQTMQHVVLLTQVDMHLGQSEYAFIDYIINNVMTTHFITSSIGAQWLSGRVLDLRPRGRGFEPHRRCCCVLEQEH